MNIDPECVRRRPTVAEGIISDESNGLVRVVEYQPDNGTRYLLVFTRVGELESRGRFGSSEDGVLVTLATDPRDQRSAIFSHRGFVEPTRVYERVARRTVCGKDTGNWVDAFALTEVIGHVLEANTPSLERMCEWAKHL